MNERWVSFGAFERKGFLAVVARASNADFLSVGIHDADDIVFPPFALDFDDTDQEKAFRPVGTKCLDCLVTDDDFAARHGTALRDPLFDTADAFARQKMRANGQFVGEEEVCKDVVTFAVGDEDIDTFFGDLACNARLGLHAASSELAFACLDVLLDTFSRCDFGDDLHSRVTGLAGVDAVDVAENGERLAFHHGGYQTGKFIVVGEHEFGERDGVVFVDNGQHVVLQHCRNAVALVEVVSAIGQVFLGGEHLSANDALFRKELHVSTDEFGLSDCRKDLSSGDGIQFFIDVKRVAPHGDSPA